VEPDIRDNPDGDTNFSPRRTFLLLLGMFATSVPVGIWQWTVYTLKKRAEERAREEALQKSVEGVRKAVREGQAGEAFNRLFLEDSQQQQPRNAKAAVEVDH